MLIQPCFTRHYCRSLIHIQIEAKPDLSIKKSFIKPNENWGLNDLSSLKCMLIVPLPHLQRFNKINTNITYIDYYLILWIKQKWNMKRIKLILGFPNYFGGKNGIKTIFFWYFPKTKISKFCLEKDELGVEWDE